MDFSREASASIPQQINFIGKLEKRWKYSNVFYH